jgi:tetratricopeptide (TPR) repeat protein
MPEKAVALYEQMLAQGKEHLGSDASWTLVAMSGLARALLETKQPDKALPLVRESIDRLRKQGPDSPQFANLLARNGYDLLKHKQDAEAEKHLRECLTIRTKKEPDDWRTFSTQSMLGTALLGQKKYAEAEAQLLKGYEGMKQREKTIPPQGAIRIPEAIDRLIALYTVTNRPHEAKQWQAERAKYRSDRK